MCGAGFEVCGGISEESVVWDAALYQWVVAAV